MKKFSVVLDEFKDSKSALVCVCCEEGIHVSWMLEDGKIISFEFVYANYPPANFCVWEDLEEYLEAIQDVDWIINNIKIPHYFLMWQNDVSILVTIFANFDVHLLPILYKNAMFIYFPA